MKTIKFLSIAIVLTIFSLQSCTNVDVPEITMHELGMENSKTVQRGEELHVDAEIIADGKISKVSIEFHLEDHGADEWELEESFSEFEGLKNAEFHKHFDIPAVAAVGEYHFQLAVVDQEGNQTIYEDEVEVTE